MSSTFNEQFCVASILNWDKMLQLLNDGVVDVNAKCDYDRTALHIVAYGKNGHTEIVELLLNKGADVNAKSIYGETALYFRRPVMTTQKSSSCSSTRVPMSMPRVSMVRLRFTFGVR